LLFLIVFP